jgi:hypothetical protein
MDNHTLEDERLKTIAVILAIVGVVTLSTVDLIAVLHNALAATSVMHGSVSYAAHHYHHHHTRTCGFKAFTQGKCFPRV